MKRGCVRVVTVSISFKFPPFLNPVNGGTLPLLTAQNVNASSCTNDTCMPSSQACMAPPRWALTSHIKKNLRHLGLSFNFEKNVPDLIRPRFALRNYLDFQNFANGSKWIDCEPSGGKPIFKCTLPYTHDCTNSPPPRG